MAAITKLYLEVALVAATKVFAGVMVKQMFHKLTDNGRIEGASSVTVYGQSVWLWLTERLCTYPYGAKKYLDGYNLVTGGAKECK